jgi:hypothetical protein
MLRLAIVGPCVSFLCCVSVQGTWLAADFLFSIILLLMWCIVCCCCSSGVQCGWVAVWVVTAGLLLCNTAAHVAHVARVLLLHCRRPMRLGGGLGGDSRAAKEPRKKLLADAAARGTTLPAAEAPVRYSGLCRVVSGAALVRTAVRRQHRCSGITDWLQLGCDAAACMLYSLVVQQRQCAAGYQVLVTVAREGVSSGHCVPCSRDSTARMHVQIGNWQE